MTATKLNRAPVRTLCVDSLAIGIDKKRKSFDHHELDEQHALDLNRSIDKLIDEDEEELEEGSSKSVPSTPCNPARPTAARPPLTRGYTIGTTGFEHLLYDIHATHQLDLHSVMNQPPTPSPPKSEEVDSPAKWLQQLAKERKERQADAFAPAPSSPAEEPAAGKGSGMHKQWALLRASSLLLSALNASREAAAAKPPASPPNADWQPTPAFDVQAFIEQSFLQQAHSGELGDLFATLGGAYNDGTMLMQTQQQQQYLMQQQQQQYLIQMQQQQQQQLLHLQQLQQQLQQQQGRPLQQQYVPPPLPTQPYAQPPLPPKQQPPQTRSPPKSPPVSIQSSPVTVTAGRLVEIAQSKEGSLTLQKALHSMSPAKLQEACDELAPHIRTLSMDTFGNYLVSSIVKLPQAQPAIVAALTGRVVELSVHPQGSRVVQSALEALPAATAGALVCELAGHIMRVAAQTCGSWSIVAAYKATHATFILAEVAGAVGYLSTLQDGSRVVQRVIPEAASHGADVSGVLDALLALGYGLGRLAADQYGNYVVQKALYHSDAERRSRLVELLLPSLPSLSTSKAGSNAAEAILAHVSADRLPDAHRLLLFECPANLAADRFGKHVISALHRRAAALGVRV